MPVLRVQSALGTSRYKFADLKTATLQDLQKEIATKWKIPPGKQMLSFTAMSDPNFIEAPGTVSLAELDFKHGTMIYMALTPDQRQTAAKEVKANPLLTSQNKSRSTTLATSEYVNNPPPEEKAPKFMPFHQWIEERQKRYKKQPWNIDPPKFNYKPVFFTSVVKKKDLPENAHVNRQKYRHTDELSFLDPRVFQRFKQSWERDNGGNKQRAAFLIGFYDRIKNPKYKEGGKQPPEIMRAQVVTMYEPNLVSKADGVKFAADRHFDAGLQIAEAMGFEVVGWMITSKPRGKITKDHPEGDIFLSGQEVVFAARFQNRFRNANTGYSRFVTMVVYPGFVDPQAYMISDQGAAMINDGLVGMSTEKSKDAFAKVMVKKAPPKAYFPAVINENKEVKQGQSFEPIAMLVELSVSAAAKTKQYFRFQRFSHPRHVRPRELQQHHTQNKDQPHHQGLSDYYLLIHLLSAVGTSNRNSVLKLAKCIKNKQRVDSSTQKIIDQVVKG